MLYELSKTIDIQLYCVNGPTIAPATMGVSELYQGPFFRYFNAQAPSLYQLANTAQHAAKSAPDLASPEDHARIMRQHGLTDVDPTNVCRFIDEQLSSQGPFDGVLGFSEGASAAATWLLRQTAPNSTQSFGFAIFLCGTAPVSPHSCDIALADELSERISIPTANIVGDKDPGYKNSLALYNLCNSHSATLYNHGRDHAIPWDPHVTEAIAKEIQGVIRRSQSGDDE